MSSAQVRREEVESGVKAKNVIDRREGRKSTSKASTVSQGWH